MRLQARMPGDARIGWRMRVARSSALWQSSTRSRKHSTIVVEKYDDSFVPRTVIASIPHYSSRTGRVFASYIRDSCVNSGTWISKVQISLRRTLCAKEANARSERERVREDDQSLGGSRGVRRRGRSWAASTGSGCAEWGKSRRQLSRWWLHVDIRRLRENLRIREQA